LSRLIFPFNSQRYNNRLIFLQAIDEHIQMLFDELQKLHRILSANFRLSKWIDQLTLLVSLIDLKFR